MKPTLSNIAKKANLSISTVSRILRKKNIRNKPNEIKVLKIAREIGYPYIQLHKKKKKKKKIALILKMESGEFYPNLFNGIHYASSKTELQINLISIKNDKNKLISEIIEIINEFYASIIFLPFLEQPDYKYIQNRTKGKKIISLAPIPDPVIQTISFDLGSLSHIKTSAFDRCKLGSQVARQLSIKRLSRGPSTQYEVFLLLSLSNP